MKKSKISSIVTVFVVLVLAVTLYINYQYTSFQKVVLDSIDEADITAIEWSNSSSTTVALEEEEVTDPQKIEKIMSVFAKMKFKKASQPDPAIIKSGIYSIIVEVNGDRAFGITVFHDSYVTIYSAKKTKNKLSSYQITNISELEPLEKILIATEASTSKIRDIEMSVRYMVYDSLKDLEQAADLIIIGAPVQSFEERDQNSAYYSDGTVQDFYSLTKVEILKNIKQPVGWVDTKQLEVVEPVGIITEADGVKTKIKAAGYNEMVQHTKYIIFLKKNSMGQYSIINKDNGKFEVEGSKHPDLKTGGDQPAEIKQKLWEEINSKYEFEYGF